MDASHIQTFLHRLGCEKIKNRGREVGATCPMARWLHPKGRDTHPSFSVKVEPDGTSVCSCFTCGTAAQLYPLLWKLDYHGASHPELFGFLAKYDRPDLVWEPPVAENDLRARLHRVANYEAIDAERAPRFAAEEPQAVVPEEVVAEYRVLPEEIRHWLHAERGLTDATIRTWELGWHPGQKRLVIPIRDETKTCVAISGRTLTRDENAPKYLHSRFKRNRVLYGEDKIVRGQVGYLCEGFFHVMYLHQLGYMNAVARMGTALSAEQAQKLVTCFTELVIIPDGDAPGRNSAAQIAALLQIRMRVRVVEMPDGKDVDGLPEDAVRILLGTPSRAA